MKTAYFDCFSGAGGDMIVASLLDAGADADTLRKTIALLPVEGYSLTIEKTDRTGFAATRFEVKLDGGMKQPHRGLKDVVKIIDNSGLDPSVKKKATEVFQRLARAEAEVHGLSTEEIHFHEVGAVDAIIDIVGTVAALNAMGVQRVLCSPIAVGSGTVQCAHGTLPIPAPATAELLKGVPIASCAEHGELCTPTAAALLTTLADQFGRLPSFTIDAVGYGEGTRRGITLPNLLRVVIGRSVEGGETDRVTVLETNIDDAPGEQVGYCIERLLAEGALDAYAVPIHMKKSRIGVLLTVLCRSGLAEAMERIIFAETTTFGIRRHEVQRSKLSRRQESVATRYGEIRMNVGEREGMVRASPEYDDCAEVASKHCVPLREVFDAAIDAWAATSQR